MLSRPIFKQDLQNTSHPGRYSDTACRIRVILADIQTQPAEYESSWPIFKQSLQNKSQKLLSFGQMLLLAAKNKCGERNPTYFFAFESPGSEL